MVSKASKFLNGWRLVFTLALVKPEPAASAEHSATAGAPPVPSNPPQPAASTPAPVVDFVGRVIELLADKTYRWRKIGTIAAKLKISESSVLDILRSIGAITKSGRSGVLVKVGTYGRPATTEQPAPNGWKSAATDNADDAEEDDYNEFDDEEDDAELDDEFDGDEESDDEEFDDEEDVAEFAAPVAPVTPPFVPAESIVRKLREKLNSPNYRWRKLPTLAQSVNLTESETRKYLSHIGARESQRGGLFRS